MAVAVAALLLYGVVAWRGAWSAGGTAGLVVGSLAAVLVGIDGLHPLRRRLTIWPFTTSARWLQFHVYGGLLAGLLSAVHVGFQWPAGRLGWFLVATGGWCAVSGLIGVVIQKQLPAALARDLTVEAAFERIPELVARLQDEADRVMSGAPGMMTRVYETDVRPSLAALQPSWAYVVDIETAGRHRLSPLRGLQAFVADADQARLDDLEAIVTEKYQLDVQFSVQRVLRGWVVLHVPVTYLFLGLVVLHIALVLSF